MSEEDKEEMQEVTVRLVAATEISMHSSVRAVLTGLDGIFTMVYYLFLLNIPYQLCQEHSGAWRLATGQ